MCHGASLCSGPPFSPSSVFLWLTRAPSMTQICIVRSDSLRHNRSARPSRLKSSIRTIRQGYALCSGLPFSPVTVVRPVTRPASSVQICMLPSEALAHRRSALPSAVKSPVPMMCQGYAARSGLPFSPVTVVRPVTRPASSVQICMLPSEALAHRRSALPSAVKSPVPMMCQGYAARSGLPFSPVTVVRPVTRPASSVQICMLPSEALAHRRSALPSAVKSPVPMMCQGYAARSGLPFSPVTVMRPATRALFMTQNWIDPSAAFSQGMAASGAACRR